MGLVKIEELNVDGYDELIDARSPAEFEEDHLPGAINLPVLDNDERALVGRVYKQESVFVARRLGAALSCKNIARHLEEHLADKPGGYRPLVYCWRGGQRSGSMTTVLSEVGWPVSKLGGGYKAFRNRVLADLRELPTDFEYRVLAGNTGSGKTALLHELARRGEQVLDLEGLANHQGSLLGAPVGGQKRSQKRFDTLLWDALRQFDAGRVVWTEAESAKIGQVYCPKALLDGIRGGLRIEVSVPLSERVAFLRRNYTRWQEDREGLLERLSRLTRRHGHEEISQWRALVELGRWDEFVERLLVTHYDPSYQRALDSAPGQRAIFEFSELSDRGCAEAAARLMDEAWNR